jgi:hypothetical protein
VAGEVGRNLDEVEEGGAHDPEAGLERRTEREILSWRRNRSKLWQRGAGITPRIFLLLTF